MYICTSDTINTKISNILHENQSRKAPLYNFHLSNLYSSSSRSKINKMILLSLMLTFNP